MLQTPLLDGKAPSAPASATVAPTAVPKPAMGGGAAGRFVKRVLDVSIALVALVVLAPLMGVVALMVALDGGPILFRRACVGLRGRIFVRLTFRTMIDDAEASFSEYLIYNPAIGTNISACNSNFDPRITAIGRVLRASSLDELPQLLNVLRGDMSLVGPTPVTVSEVERYQAVAPLYFSMRPGLWQTDGSGELHVAARLHRDERYVREWSLAKDLAILAGKAGIVLRRRGKP